MALDRNNAMLDVTGAWIHQVVKEQSWYRENANTITTVGGLIASILAALAATPFATNPHVQLTIIIAGWVLTVFGVKVTHNGFSKSQVAKIEQAQVEYITAADFHTEPEPAEAHTYSDLAIEAYLNRNK